jgi:hypothetical protein
MVLIDSSVWINFFNGSETESVQTLEDLIAAEEDVCISGYILTEVLQGFRDDRSFETVRRQLLKLTILDLNVPDSYIKAAQLYRRCRKQGITIRRTADCIIAQTAIENKLFLLHDDADFDKIAQVCPLKIYSKKQS